MLRDDPDHEISIPGLDEVLAASCDLSAGEGGSLWTLKLGKEEGLARIRWPAWSGDRRPVLLFHHASSEVPYDFPGPLGLFNLFRRLCLAPGAHFPEFLCGSIEAPFHESPREFKRHAYASGRSTMAMIGASMLIADKAIARLKGKGYGPIILAGYSLGGVVASWHLARFGTADLYVPIAASPDMHSMLMSGFLPVEGREKKAHLRCYKEAFDLSSLLEPESMRGKCFPLLASYDELVPPARAREVWRGFDVTWADEGHLTLFMKEARIARHIRDAVSIEKERAEG